MRKTALLLCMLPGILLMSLQSAFASGNISDTDKYAWGQTSGWINFRPTDAGVMVNQAFLSGFAWAENIGWIKILSLSNNGDPVSNLTGSYQIAGMDKDHNLSATFAEYIVKRIYSGGYACAKTISEA